MAPSSKTIPDVRERYEVLAHLGVGGMGEIVLARLEGVDEPVVVKRLLPHLAREPSFVRMFVDESRILAGIRHPNVVEVRQVRGDAGGDLALVMEYVEGETLGAILRAASTGDALDVGLAAHVVAEACAGLHAAHELRDERGALRNVVHRDVSPQNVMVGYDGAVKVLDFGIAKADSRATRTTTGHVKGKHEYMSPEQCLGQPLDRRSDVFSLGILLYELTVGRPLFRRENALLTFKAICEEPIAPPSAVVAGYPARLEAIVLRALAREPDERYATALEMRLELEGAARELAGEEPAKDTLAAWMRARFAANVEEKRHLARRSAENLRVLAAPESLPPTASDVAPIRLRTKARAAWLAVAVALVVGCGVAWVRAPRGREVAAAPPPAATAMEAPPRSSPPPAPSSAPPDPATPQASETRRPAPPPKIAPHRTRAPARPAPVRPPPAPAATSPFERFD